MGGANAGNRVMGILFSTKLLLKASFAWEQQAFHNRVFLLRSFQKWVSPSHTPFTFLCEMEPCFLEKELETCPALSSGENPAYEGWAQNLPFPSLPSG